ncbi:hypothetical protein MKZ24_02025 [Paenibacillus sp. FSL R7-0297]|uniref:hypothetical protein n=1 Tax=unclassified Paenibacillus TaxID=185978 RepID=UPI0004F718B7|nr:hypothetical protein [Paenibacillus sp. FSL R5-0912]AIQ39062.1 hypothetical protein R50912_02630 [Paenibacillus sp. FSL R5-0912]
MNDSLVVTGRIIEIHANRVLTQQGDTISTYHPRYYILPEAEMWTPAEADLNEASFIELGGKGGASVPKRRWKARMPWFTPQKKSANRI